MKRPKHPPTSPRTAQPLVPLQVWLAGAALVVLVAIVYQPTLSNGFIWDDDVYIEENPTLTSLSGLRDIWFKIGAVPQYYPLVHSTFWLEVRAWGLFPAGFHAVNLLLHGVSALLLWRLLLRLAVPGAWLAAAIFAVHPVGVESVAWVTERKNVLSCALALAALLQYLRFSPPEPPPTETNLTPHGPWWHYWLALGLFVAGLLSKTVTASVPAVLLVIYWWKRGRITRTDVVWLLPFFAVGIGLGLVTVWMERSLVGAEGDAWNLSLVERVLVAGRALWFYAGKLIWPAPLIFFYPRWTIDAGDWRQYLFPTAALAVVIGLWLARHRIGRGPLAAVLIFAGVLVPALGFFNVYPFLFSYVADHFQYHASVALMALAAATLTWGVARIAGQRRWVAPVVTAAVLLPLALVARNRTLAYHDLASLYEDTIAANPAAWPAHVNLGYQLQQAGDFPAAVAHYREALRLYPPYASVHIRLGTALFLNGEVDEAIAELKAALAAPLSDVERATAHVHYGIILNWQRKFDEAIEHFQGALAIRAENAAALLNYGIALEGRGDVDSGIDTVRKSLTLQPRSALAQHTLGTMLAAHDRAAEAVGPLETAVQLQPQNSTFRYDLAAALLAAGNARAAEIVLRQTLHQHPGSLNARLLLAKILAERGETQTAILELRTVLTMDANNEQATSQLQHLEQAAPGRPAPATPADRN